MAVLSAQDGFPSESWNLARILAQIPPNGPAYKYGNITYRPDKKSKMSPVVFSHALHRTRYTCRVCHLELDFALSRKKSGVSRAGNLSGHYCGSCHNGVIAFSVKQAQTASCDRCHMENNFFLKKRFSQETANLPAEGYGNHIDWNLAIDSESIKPIDNLFTVKRYMGLPAKLNKPLELGTSAPRSGVLFSHQAHLQWLDCSNCHPRLFKIEKKGTTNFTMERSLYGFYCGTCHMRVAFPLQDCNRCHPQMRSQTGHIKGGG